ncbi:restriction endonuclease subunit S [Vibrio parahaemolyticus]|uniref:restriction endonuclease subunit S n=1 Tax=Vibrio parahaemolyticus TaxID=670 RepID=UPI00111DAE27|nr:restriction endonuclease subunit S [Vibrio parahaemolyticus]TNY99739.1 restriction endonuclease subunit S [Vibrio parahaemolyticus]
MSWPTYKLGNLVSIKGGGTPSKKIEEYWNGNIPWASVKDLKSRLLLSTEDSITQLGVEKSATNIISKGTIIVPTRMALGKVAIAGVDLAINQDLKALLVNDSGVLDRDYLARLLESKAKYIESEGKGATVKGITIDFLKELNVPLPPLAEQKRIAAILDKADAIRQKRKQAIELADEFLRSVFLDMFGDPVTNPKGWEVKPLSELIADGDKINYGIVQPGEHIDGGVPIVRVGDIADGKINKSNLKCVLKEIDKKNKKSRLVGDEILITCVGATVGKVALADSSLKGFNTVRALTRVRLNHQVNRQFVFRYLQSPFIKNYFQMQLRTVAQPTLNGKQIGETPIMLPEKDVQKAFLDIAEKVQSKASLALRQLVKADELFNSLSQKAFSGQL